MKQKIATDLSTREARLALPVRPKPYFVKLSPGLYLGYRRNRGLGTWSVRVVDGRLRDTLEAVGVADDEDAVPRALNYLDARTVAYEKAGVKQVRVRSFNPQAPHAELIKHWAQRTHRRLLYRAKAQQRVCDVTVDDLVRLIVAADARCVLTGLPLIFPAQKNSGPRSPYTASVDRIDNRQGYVLGNVRVICWAMNVALSEWGDEHFSAIALAYLARRDNALAGTLTRLGFVVEPGLEARPTKRGSAQA